MVGPAIQSSEHDGQNDDDNHEDPTTESQPQTTKLDSGNMPPLETNKAVTAAPVSTSPAMNGDDEEVTTTVVRASSPTSPVQVPSTETDKVLASTPELVGSSGQHARLQGAWTKPLIITRDACFASHLDNGSGAKSDWPALSTKHVGQKKDQDVTIQSKSLRDANRIAASQTLRSRIPTDKARFPWAARMNPQTRNLHRVTEPEYMEDGTPKVIIPDYVLLHGLQNHKEYVIGQFDRCLMPSGGLVYAVLNKLWGRKCEISIRKLGEFSYIFHIPDEGTRKWILQRSLWHVDDCIMFVAPWTASETLTLPKITSIPLWVKLKNIPSTLYSILGIEWIASGLGEPMLSYKPWLDPTMLGEAKVMVEVELDKPFPQKISAWDKQGNYSLVDVEYPWLPTPCEKCGQIGHKKKRCLSISGQKASGIGNKVASVARVFSSSANAASTGKETTVPSDLAHDKVTSLNPQLEIMNEPSMVDNASHSDAEELASLATISELENMSVPPIIVCMNETIESPLLETAPSSTKQISTEIRRIEEFGLGSNTFASLVTSDGEEEEQLDPDDSTDFLTPFGKRLLRERPVKPSAKAKELQLQSTSRGRGARGRGNKGRNR